MKSWILKRWDWFVYCRAFHSLRRMCERDPAFARVLELHIKGYVEQSNISEESKRAAEIFYDNCGGGP